MCVHVFGALAVWKCECPSVGTNTHTADVHRNEWWSWFPFESWVEVIMVLPWVRIADSIRLWVNYNSSFFRCLFFIRKTLNYITKQRKTSLSVMMIILVRVCVTICVSESWVCWRWSCCWCTSLACEWLLHIVLMHNSSCYHLYDKELLGNTFVNMSLHVNRSSVFNSQLSGKINKPCKKKKKKNTLWEFHWYLAGKAGIFHSKKEEC